MKKKTAYILIGSIIGLALIIWIISSLRKGNSDSSNEDSNGGFLSNIGIEPSFTWGFGAGSGDNGFDWNFGAGGTGRETYDSKLPNNIHTGMNTFENTLYPTDDYLPKNYMSFNQGDATAPRSEHIPLTKGRTTIYSAPFNQWGGTIKNF